MPYNYTMRMSDMTACNARYDTRLKCTDDIVAVYLQCQWGVRAAKANDESTKNYGTVY